MLLDVIVFGSSADRHAISVVHELRRRGRCADIWCAADLHETDIEWAPEEGLKLNARGKRLAIDKSTAAWWRRPGVPKTSGLNLDEAQLVYDEVTNILPGLAVSTTERCIDDPWHIERAANKTLQLSIASQLDVAIPTTIITNSRNAMRTRFPRGAVIAKPLSPGVGLAPYAAELLPSDHDFLSACPTQIQERVDAIADLRIVTLGRHVLVWERSRRGNEPLDWRQADPSGSGFRFISDDPTGGLASAISKNLGLTFSVQDWLLTTSPVFLEVNPQGQWLFLAQSAEFVPPLLADLLLGELDV